jgi:hypothetical protein
MIFQIVTLRTGRFRAPMTVGVNGFDAPPDRNTWQKSGAATYWPLSISGAAMNDPPPDRPKRRGGEPGGTYTLFSAPQFQVAMHLAEDGPGTHSTTQVGLLF